MIPYQSLEDQDLLDLLKSGDRSAFAEIYNRYKLILHNHAWNKVRNREEAQDAIQEVFAALWLKRESLNVGSNLAGYLYTAVRNHLLNLIVRKGVQEKYLSSMVAFAETGEVETDFRVRENQLKAIIDQEIAELPERMREVFTLSRTHNLSYKEIAEVMGVSEETVRAQMKNALRTLRSKLGLLLYILLIFKY